MYKVKLDGQVIHYGPAGIGLIDPVLELEENKTGSFKFSMAPGNPGYHLPRKLLSRVEVWCDGEALYYGRVFDESVSLDRIKTVTCEGELSDLIDSRQQTSVYRQVTVSTFLKSLLEEHNRQVEEFKRFELGTVTVQGEKGLLDFITDWEDTLQCVQEKLAGRLGGRLVVRHEGGRRYLDYLESIRNPNAQTIEFGRNLIDYSQTTSAENIATCIIPLGAKQERAEDAAEDEPERYLTIESVNDGKNYVCSEAAVETYGWVTTTVNFEEVTDPQELKEKGEEYLKNTQYDTLSLTLTAFDLGHLDADIRKIRVGDEVRVYSKPHDMDRYFPVTKQTINLNNPEKDQIELGTTVSKKLTDRVIEGNQKILERIESLPSQSNTVTLAEEAARRFAVMAAATVGYYTTQETLADGSVILYSHDKPKLEESKNIWKKTGLVVAVSSDGGKTWRGMDKDGNAILKEVSAKTITADKIVSGRMETEDGRFYIDLDKGESTATKLVTEESWLEQYPTHSIELIVGQEAVNEFPRLGQFLKIDGVPRVFFSVGSEFTVAGIGLIDEEGNEMTVNAQARNLRLKAAFNGGKIMLLDNTEVMGDLEVRGNLKVKGLDKQRVVETSKGLVGINAYETAEPYFGDIGESKTDENGQVRIDIDPLFAETVNTSCPYQVALYPYCRGSFYVSKREEDYFVVKGPKNGAFSYEIKARQKGNEMKRLKIESI